MARAQSDSNDTAAEIRLDIADEAALAWLAARIAPRARPGDFIALEGDLGAGKSSFARAFIHALQDEPEDVPSPTFTLVQSYETRAGTVLHVDLYRIADAAEAGPLGLFEALADAILLVEWPERLGTALPADRLRLRLDFGTGPESRIATLSARGRWAAILGELAAHG